MNRDKKYEEAIAELEKLVESIEDPQRDLSSVEGDIKKAMKLIEFCRDAIKGQAADLEKLLKDKNED